MHFAFKGCSILSQTEIWLQTSFLQLQEILKINISLRQKKTEDVTKKQAGQLFQRDNRSKENCLLNESLKYKWQIFTFIILYFKLTCDLH